MDHVALNIPWFVQLRLLRVSFDLNDLLAVVVAALLAHAMVQLHLAAAGALGDTRHGQLPMSATTRVSPCLGDFSFRSGHKLHLLIVLHKRF